MNKHHLKECAENQDVYERVIDFYYWGGGGIIGIFFFRNIL